jgi:hypothetical protein
MQRVIVTVKREGEAKEYDLDVPAEVKVGQLATLIVQALHWDNDQAEQPSQYQIEAEPPSRVLDAAETLADAGAWDGAWLIFRPVQSITVASPSPKITPPARLLPSSDPVIGWRPLDIDLPSEDEELGQEEDSAPTSGFVWKRLD